MGKRFETKTTYCDRKERSFYKVRRTRSKGVSQSLSILKEHVFSNEDHFATAHALSYSNINEYPLLGSFENNGNNPIKSICNLPLQS